MFKLNWRAWFKRAPAQAAMEAAGAELLDKVADHILKVAHGIYTEHIDTGEQIAGLQKLPGTDKLRSHVVSTAPHSVLTEFGHLTRGGGTWVAPVPAIRQGIWSAKAAFPAIASQIKLIAPGKGNHAQHLGATVEG